MIKLIIVIIIVMFAFAGFGYFTLEKEDLLISNISSCDCSFIEDAFKIEREQKEFYQEEYYNCAGD